MQSFRPRLGRSALAVRLLACALSLAAAMPADATQKTTLYRFTGSPDGDDPTGLLVGPGGILYGQTFAGGIWGRGTIFKLVPPGVGQTQWTETVLYSFRGQFGPSGAPLYDGEAPLSNVVMDKAGNLFGTTSAGGQFNGGTVFRLSPPPTGQTAWTETVLYRYFHQNPLRDGETGQTAPFGHLYLDSSDVIYGLTSYTSNDAGAVYRLAAPSSGVGFWNLSTLTTFDPTINGVDPNPTDGYFPTGGVARGRDGSLYGATEGSGAPGAGVAWRLTPPAAGQTAWTRQNFYTFGLGSRLNGLLPVSLPILDRNQDLYGTLMAGGASNSGVVYKLAPPTPGQTAWTQNVLYSFPINSYLRDAAPLVDGGGSLYGTTYRFGLGTCAEGFDCGTVYKLTPRDPDGRMTPWNFVNIYTFSSLADGAEPSSLVPTVLPDGRFALFGVTTGFPYEEKSAGDGTVFEIIP